MQEIEAAQRVAPESDQFALEEAARGPSRPRHWLDWGMAARLMAQGSSIEAVAASLGCEPQRIYRNLRRSRRFRARIELEFQRQRLAAQMRVSGQAEEVARQIELRRGALDGRMLQWLVEKMGLVRGRGPIEGQLAREFEAVARNPLKIKA